MYLRIIDILSVQKTDSSPSYKLAYVKLLNSLVTHKSGFDWVVSTNFWTDVLSYCMTSPTLYIIRESYDFMYNLLVQAVAHDQIFCNTVVRKIMQPLVVRELRNASGITEINEEKYKERLTPALRLVIYILEQHLRNECLRKGNYLIPQLFLQDCHLEQAVSGYLMISKNEDLVFDLGNATLLIYFVDLCLEAREPMFTSDEVQQTAKKVFTIICNCISKKHHINVTKISYLTLHYLKVINVRMPPNCFTSVDSYKRPLTFENQLIVMLTFPMFTLLMRRYPLSFSDMNIDEIRDLFCMKFFQISCEHTIRMVYNFRNVLMEDDIDDIMVSQKALFYTVLAKKYYNRDQAIIVFQCLIYMLHDLVMGVKDNSIPTSLLNQCASLMHGKLEALATFIEEFRITWKDCIETVCVMGCAIDFINMFKWPIKVRIFCFHITIN